MNTCGTCKHWRDPVNEYSNHAYRFLPPEEDDKDWKIAAPDEPWPEYRACSRIFMREGDERIDYTPAGQPDVIHPPTDPAYVQDGSDYFAELRTTAEFGCSLWEAKEDA